MMALADKDVVIRLIGSPSPREQEKMDIDETLENADGVVYEITRKDNWSPNEYGYRLAVQAANKYAAAELLNEFYDPKNRAPQFTKDFEDIIEKLRRTGYGGDKDSGNPMFQVAIGSYKENVLKNGPFISKGFFGADFMDWSEFYTDE